MTTETEAKREELMAYGVAVTVFPGLVAAVTQLMQDAKFLRYRGGDTHHPQVSVLGFVFDSPVLRGEAPVLPTLPAGATLATRYLRVASSLVPLLSDGLPLDGRQLRGSCGEQHLTDSNGCAACWKCFVTEIQSGRFCG